MQKVFSIEENIRANVEQMAGMSQEVLRYEGQLQLLQSLRKVGVETLEIDEEKLKEKDYVVPKRSVEENIEETIGRIEKMTKEILRLEGSVRFLRNIQDGGVNEVQIDEEF
jgi:ACT domain-containing protein